ncbi:hypothetical protein [Nostoc sp. ChiQUE01b]|uniref:hypothetical protein n=1 Tax=Nostoc sp. ChiQUE01b TaxID=3075376 RepID=UPI002AD3D9FC|nr:hypothetical protein [Nostoc sp. ChiQUE01b]MDZ8258870.1 hypothetical protein [Nostoc sp. ChiQUE01b]
MTHVRYTQQALSRYTLPRLKRIATELGVTPTGDKRAADTWVNAIITHQSAQTYKIADEQTTAQAEARDKQQCERWSDLMPLITWELWLCGIIIGSTTVEGAVIMAYKRIPAAITLIPMQYLSFRCR